MASHDKEIEIQVEVGKIKPLLDFLKKKAKLIGETSQIDRYFTPKHRDFLEKYPTEEWLRLRDAGGKFTINYKHWKYDSSDRGLFADEFESVIENIDQLEKIFASLDMKEVTTIHKISRQTWVYKDYEIVLDKIKNLGEFIEIEYCGNNKKLDYKKINAEMIKFLKDLGCGKVTQNHSGYPYMMLFPDKVKYEVH